MNNDSFGNLREWGSIPGQVTELIEAGNLDEHQEGLIRLLKYQQNWRLREIAINAIKELRSPTSRLISAALDIVMDDGLHYEVRIPTARSLTALLSRNDVQCEGDTQKVACQVVEKISTLLESPQPPVMHNVIRECLTTIHACA